MISLKKIKAVTSSPKFIAFADFVIEGAGDRDFPCYQEMDLMKIPSLVPNIWVFDLRGGLDNGAKYHFSGTKVDEHFGRTLTGLMLEDIYSGDDYEQVVTGCYHKAFRQKKVAYTYRTARYADSLIDRFNLVETLMFPCSSNNSDIDFAIGLVTYSQVDQKVENIYTLL
ncbi:MAG: hypothetical protein HQ512_09220 [Rhodospirillales bacterium]|nr:hypothetical protein [Rhodospirillales bacterium]